MKPPIHPERRAAPSGRMGAYLAGRAAQSAATLLLISVAVFAMMFAVGDPTAQLMPRTASERDRARLRAEYGLDRPMVVQYGRFIGRIARGDLGQSYLSGRSVGATIAERAPATFELACASLLLAMSIGLPLGVLCGARPRARLSRFILHGSLLGISLPTFWIGLLLIMLLAVQTEWMPEALRARMTWVPTGGRGPTREALGADWSVLTARGWAHLALPALTLALHHIALLIRLVRSELKRALEAPHVRVARAYGFTERAIVGRFALRNTLIPVVTVTGVEFGQLMAFSVVTETVFNWPGLGRLLIQSIENNDRPLVMAYLLLTGALFLAINFVVDLTYAWVDPRVRLAGAAS